MRMCSLVKSKTQRILSNTTRIPKLNIPCWFYYINGIYEGHIKAESKSQAQSKAAKILSSKYGRTIAPDNISVHIS